MADVMSTVALSVVVALVGLLVGRVICGSLIVRKRDLNSAGLVALCVAMTSCDGGYLVRRELVATTPITDECAKSAQARVPRLDDKNVVAAGGIREYWVQRPGAIVTLTVKEEESPYVGALYFGRFGEPSPETLREEMQLLADFQSAVSSTCGLSDAKVTQTCRGTVCADLDVSQAK